MHEWSFQHFPYIGQISGNHLYTSGCNLNLMPHIRNSVFLSLSFQMKMRNALL